MTRRARPRRRSASRASLTWVSQLQRSQLITGPHCLDSSRLYHSLSHWEHKIYNRVRGLYRDLLRAKDIDVSDDEGGKDHDDDGQASDASVEELGFRSATPQRVHDLRGTRLPDHEDVNAVLEWMEEQKYQNAVSSLQ